MTNDTQMVYLRITPELKEQLKLQAEKRGLTLVAYIRMVLMHHHGQDVRID